MFSFETFYSYTIMVISQASYWWENTTCMCQTNGWIEPLAQSRFTGNFPTIKLTFDQDSNPHSECLRGLKLRTLTALKQTHPALYISVFWKFLLLWHLALHCVGSSPNYGKDFIVWMFASWPTACGLFYPEICLGVFVYHYLVPIITIFLSLQCFSKN